MTTPDLGRALILLAVTASTVGAVVAFAAGLRPTPSSWAWTRRFAYAYAALMAAASVGVTTPP